MSTYSVSIQDLQGNEIGTAVTGSANGFTWFKFLSGSWFDQLEAGKFHTNANVYQTSGGSWVAAYASRFEEGEPYDPKESQILMLGALPAEPPSGPLQLQLSLEWAGQDFSELADVIFVFS